MKYIEAPNRYKPRKHELSLYIAGGITGCPDWQKDLVRHLVDTNLILYNPRRREFPINNPDAAKEQIQWEAEYLRCADEILFWFPRESICPIALYELGAWSMTKKRLYIGVHPAYARKRDIEEQTHLARPDVKLVYTFIDLVEQVKSKPLHNS